MSAAVEAAAGEPFLTFMRKQIFEPLGMRDTKADSATEPIPNRVTPYFPRFAADPRYGPDPMRPTRLFLLRGIQRIPVHAVRPGALRHGDQQRQAAATRHSPITPDVTATGLGAGDRLRSWLGPRDRRRWRVSKLARSATTGSRWAGWWRPLMTFPEHGIVVSVTSNISYADTSAVALKIAQAFAEQGRSSARK